MSSSTTVYLGVDPGAGGGIMSLIETEDPTGSVVHEVIGCNMPDSEQGVWKWLREMGQRYHEARWYGCVEQVTGFIAKKGREDMAHGGQPGHSMFKFGMSYGSLRMAVVAFGLEEFSTFWCPTPNQWMSALGIRHRNPGETDSQWKNHLRSVAVDLFPGVVVTLGFADALLLAYYCRGKVLGKFTATKTRTKRAGGGR